MDKDSGSCKTKTAQPVAVESLPSLSTIGGGGGGGGGGRGAILSLPSLSADGGEGREGGRGGGVCINDVNSVREMWKGEPAACECGEFQDSPLSALTKCRLQNKEEEGEDWEDYIVREDEEEKDIEKHHLLAVSPDGSSRKAEMAANKDETKRTPEKANGFEAEIYYTTAPYGADMYVDQFGSNKTPCCGDTFEDERPKYSDLSTGHVDSMPKCIDRSQLRESNIIDKACDDDHRRRRMSPVGVDCSNDVLCVEANRVNTGQYGAEISEEEASTEMPRDDTSPQSSRCMTLADATRSSDLVSENPSCDSNWSEVFLESTLNYGSKEILESSAANPLEAELSDIVDDCPRSTYTEDKLCCAGISISELTDVNDNDPKSSDAEDNGLIPRESSYNRHQLICEIENGPKSNYVSDNEQKTNNDQTLIDAGDNGLKSTGIGDGGFKQTDVGDCGCKSTDVGYNGFKPTGVGDNDPKASDVVENAPKLTVVGNKCPHSTDVGEDDFKSTDASDNGFKSTDYGDSGLKSSHVDGNGVKSTDVDINGTDAQQENCSKVVTFAEDKEVFDMGYVLPASVTVHLDTPVSSIAPGDVQISTEPVLDPVCDSAVYPISGILKTEDGGDNREEPELQDQRRDQIPSGLNSGDIASNLTIYQLDYGSCMHPGPENVSLSTKTQELLPPDLQVNPLTMTNHSLDLDIVGGGVISQTMDVAAGLLPNPAALTGSCADMSVIAGNTTADCYESERDNTTESTVDGGQLVTSTWTSSTPVTTVEVEVLEEMCGNGEEEEMAGHRGFVVEAVPEHELLCGDDICGVGMTSYDGAVKPIVSHSLNGNGVKAASAPGDGGSHSTDSNYQDTIGPLDNPQFLKTLNYTASQAFDQDEHFGLHSAALDARSLAGLQDPTDLDAGWAWVVLLACFVGTSLLGATVYSAGVLMSVILEEVENDLTKASWIGSVFVCVMSLSGPFVGSVLGRFGARWTVSCAGFVISLGFIGASLSSTITQLILTHGVLAGLGAGFTLNPLFVTVGQYFNRYRGFACGILAMGAGAGILIGGAFVSYLLSMFDLSGAYLIWAGVMLHVTPVGLLLLPSPEERVRQIERDQTIGDLKSQPDGASMNSGQNSLFGSVNQSMLSGIDRISIGTHGRRVIIPGSLVSRRPSKFLMNPGTPHAGGEADVPLLKGMLHNDISRSSHSVNRSTVYAKPALNRSSSDICGPLSPALEKTPILEGQVLLVPGDTTRSVSQNHLPLSSNLSPSSNTLNSLALTSPSPYVRYQSGYPRPVSLSQNLHPQGPQSQYTSTSHISARLSLRSGYTPTAPRGELDNESLTSAFVSNLRPRDIVSPRHPLGSRSISTLLGSVASFPTSLAIVKDDLRRFEPTAPYGGSLKGYAIAVLDSMRILRNKPFCVFLTTNFFWALGESPVLIHLPSFVVSRGTTPMQASSLYTSMGIASMVGRFLSGLIATDVNIGPVLIYTGSLGVAGLVIIMCPLMTSTFWQQVLFSFLVGLYTGALVPLTSLITIELLGIAELSLGFGMISMAQGLGYLIGPPLSSVVVKALGFLQAFVTSGFVLIMGSLLALSMTLFLMASDGDEDEELGLNGQENEDSHPLSDLQRALQRLARDSCSSAQEDDYVDNRSQVSERSRLNTGEDRNGTGDEGGRIFSASNNTHCRDGGGGLRVQESSIGHGMVTLEDVYLGVADQAMAEETNNTQEPAWSGAGVSPVCKEDTTLAPVRAFDELDTIVEVVGK